MARRVWLGLFLCSCGWACGGDGGTLADAGAPEDSGIRVDAGDSMDEDHVPPTVFLTSPAPGASGVAPNSSVMVAFDEPIAEPTLSTASFLLRDSHGTSVAGTVSTFPNGGTLAPSEPLEPGESYTAVVTTAVTDVAGNSLATEHGWSFESAGPPDVTSPHVLWVNPAESDSQVPRSAVFEVVFDEPIDPTSLQPGSISLLGPDGVSLAGTVSGVGTTVTFTPTWWLEYESRYTATVTTAVRDLAGNPLATEVSSWFQTEPAPDLAPPQVLITTPAANAIDVPVDTAISITFDEPIDPATLNATSFTLRDQLGQLVSATVEAVSAGGTLVPTHPLAPGAVYTPRLTISVTDSLGNPLPSAYAWSFTTRAPAWGLPSPVENDNTGDAEQPQVAMDAAGNAVAVWVLEHATGRNIWTNTYTPDIGWQQPECLSEPLAEGVDRPAVAMNAAGDAIIVWQQGPSYGRQVWATRREVGGSWSLRARIDEPALGDARNPRVALDGAGNATVAWERTATNFGEIWATRYEVGSGWLAPVFVSEECPHQQSELDLEAGLAGDVLVIFVSEDILGAYASASQYQVGTGWSTPVRLSSEASTAVDSVDLGIDAEGRAVAVWRRSFEDELRSRSYSPGFGWGYDKRVDPADTAEESSPRVAVGSGHSIVVWVRHGDPKSSILASHAVLGGWSAAVPIEEDDAGVAYYPRVAMSALGNAVAVWPHEVESRFDILASRYRHDVGWTVPQAIEFGDEGDAYWPTVAMNAYGRAIAVWQQWDGVHQNIMSNVLSAEGGP